MNFRRNIPHRFVSQNYLRSQGINTCSACHIHLIVMQQNGIIMVVACSYNVDRRMSVMG